MKTHNLIQTENTHLRWTQTLSSFYSTIIVARSRRWSLWCARLMKTVYYSIFCREAMELGCHRILIVLTAGFAALSYRRNSSAIMEQGSTWNMVPQREAFHRILLVCVSAKRRRRRMDPSMEWWRTKKSILYYSRVPSTQIIAFSRGLTFFNHRHEKTKILPDSL